MAIARVLAPKRRSWLIGTVAVSSAGLAAYGVAASVTPWAPGSAGGLISGSIAAAMFVNAGLYPLRRRWQARPWGTAQRWLQLHIYGSFVALLLVFVHVGFEWPAGAMGTWLLLLSVWAVLSGLGGVLLQKWIPPALAARARVEAIYERIPELVRALATKADGIVEGAAPALAGTYSTDIRPHLQEPRMSWSWVADPDGMRARLREPIGRLRPFVQDGDDARLRDLEAVFEDKLDLDLQGSMQRALRLWLVTHVPPALLLLGLIVVHVFAVAYF
jgi:hypothetical protein